jgi:hypothetical protein
LTCQTPQRAATSQPLQQATSLAVDVTLVTHDQPHGQQQQATSLAVDVALVTHDQPHGQQQQAQPSENGAGQPPAQPLGRWAAEVNGRCGICTARRPAAFQLHLMIALCVPGARDLETQQPLPCQLMLPLSLPLLQGRHGEATAS